MSPPFSRMIVLKNRTTSVIKIMEWRYCAPDSSYSYEIKLCPHGCREISARLFHQRAMDACRPTVLKIFVDNIDTLRILTPQHFIDYAEIRFQVDDNGQVIVTGVKAKLIELRRLRGLGFLLGRTYHYEGRTAKIIT